MLDQLGVKKDFRNIREEKEEALRLQIEKERADRGQSLFSGDSDSSSAVDDLKALLEMSREDSKALATASGGKVGEDDGAMQETLLYGLGFVVGVGGVLGGLAIGLGLIDSPFPDNGGVVTPAARRVAAPAGAPSVDPKLKAVELNDDPF